MPASVENRMYREFAVTALDNFYKLDPIMVIKFRLFLTPPLQAAVANTPALLDSLFALFFDRQKFREIPVPRKRCLIRVFNYIFDSHTKSIVQYAGEKTLVQKLAEIVESDDVREVLTLLLASEKKYVDRSGIDVDFTLIEVNTPFSSQPNYATLCLFHRPLLLSPLLLLSLSSPYHRCSRLTLAHGSANF